MTGIWLCTEAWGLDVSTGDPTHKPSREESEAERREGKGDREKEKEERARGRGKK